MIAFFPSRDRGYTLAKTGGNQEHDWTFSGTNMGHCNLENSVDRCNDLEA